MILGFFWVGKFGKYLFGWLDLSRDSWEVLLTLAKCSWVYELTYTNIEFVMFKVLEIWHGIFWGLIFGPGIFLGFVGSPRDLFGK